MQKEYSNVKNAQIGEVCYGFRLLKKEYVASKEADLYTMRHEKSGAELLYFDRADENKTFAISFKTLPEDHTGVFHILEHSVLNGSRKYPVKEPFVSMLQSSMQTFLNAMTYNDKTVYPVASRNDQDFFNLVKIYLDAVFCPMIYERPEIFMQEGWHYEFEQEDAEPYYNGVVFSEMKGAYADVDTIIDDEMSGMLFPDNSYGYVSGGHPEHITELTYEQFLNAHRRFYHPSNAKIFLDGQMNPDAVLQYMDEEYLANYDACTPDFDFVLQTPVTAEKTVEYEAQEGEETLAHMAIGKILCNHAEVEKLYAAQILASYLTGSNAAPLKRAFLEKGLAQDVSLYAGGEGAYQPTVMLVVRNTDAARFAEIKEFVPQTVKEILKNGIDKEALSAALERYAFKNREITESYGVDLAVKALDGWLYGDDPLTHIDNGEIFRALREKLDTNYFAELLEEMLADPADKSYLYVLPSLTKGREDAEREEARLQKAIADWDDGKMHETYEAFLKMQQWQQSEDSEEVLAMLPHLDLKDIPRETKPIETECTEVSDVTVLHVKENTNGIVYLNLYFDISDFSIEEMRMLSVAAGFFGKLRTESTPADALQTRIKAILGKLSMSLNLTSKPADLENCRMYLSVSASMLEENVPQGMALLKELLLSGKYDETDRMLEILLQYDYFQKQAMINSGHMYAMAKALSAYSREGAISELVAGESYNRWFSEFAEAFPMKSAELAEGFEGLLKRAFAANRLFVGYGGNLPEGTIAELTAALPESPLGERVTVPQIGAEACAIEITGGVGFSALGHNLYALGGEYNGASIVLTSLMSYGYLWNAVRVQGGAYGTGMRLQRNGDLVCYSYRDPALENTQAAYGDMADYLAEYLEQDMPLDDIIIGSVNTTDPLLAPGSSCAVACRRYLEGVTHEAISKTRREILDTTPDDLRALIEPLRKYLAEGKLCVVGDKETVAFIAQK